MVSYVIPYIWFLPLTPLFLVRTRSLARSRDASRSRLALVWQATSEADLYVVDEMTAMQVQTCIHIHAGKGTVVSPGTAVGEG